MVRILTGRRALITGASGGIGRCLAEQLAERGAHVALVARSSDKLLEIVQSIVTRGGKALAIPADVTRAADRQHALETVVERFDGLDVLINNAGVGSFGHFGGSREAILRQVMEVNFFAPAELIRLAVPVLKKGQQPAIVNIASMCGRCGLPAWPEYSASKFALAGLSEALRAELVRQHIDVILALPGLTRTDLGEHLARNEGRMTIDFSRGMKPEAVATRIVHALVKNRSEVIVGRDARLLISLHRFLPRLLDRLMARKVKQLYAIDRECAHS